MSTKKGQVSVPASAKKMVDSLKEVVKNVSETEIYATLKDCNMDPDEAVNRLLSQDQFHEVKSKREKKKEGKDSNEYKPRGGNSSSTRGGRSDVEPYLGHNGSTPYYSSESPLIQGKYVYRKKTEATPYASSWPSDPSVSGNNVNSNGTAGLSSDTSAENVRPSLVGGQLSMADIVKMGRPHNKVATANGGSHNECSSRFPDTNVSKVMDEWPSTEKSVASVLESNPEITVDSHIPRFNSEYQDYEANKNEETGENEGFVGFNSISNREFPDDDSRRGSQYETDLWTNMGSSYLPREHDFERHEVDIGGGSVSLVTRNMQQLTVESNERVLPSEGDPDAPMIIQFPDHLKVNSADLSHLHFGNLHASMSIPSSTGLVTTLPAETSLVRHSEINTPSFSHQPTRELEYYGDDLRKTLINGTLYHTTGFGHESFAPQFKPPMDAGVIDYNRLSDYSNEDLRFLNAAMCKLNYKMQDQTSFPNDTHQSHPTGSFPTSFAANVQPKYSREFELEYYSRFNSTPDRAAKYGLHASAISGSTMPVSEPAPNNLSWPSGPTGGLSGQQHLSLDPYSQPSLPSDLYANIIGGNPSLPQSSVGVPSGFQQQMPNNSPYHQSSAAARPFKCVVNPLAVNVPHSAVLEQKIPNNSPYHQSSEAAPPFKCEINPLAVNVPHSANVVQKMQNNSTYHQFSADAVPFKCEINPSAVNVPYSADLASRYGYGGPTNEDTAGNFSIKQPNTLSGRNLNYDDVLSSQYNNSFSLQNENSSMWPRDQGPISRTTAVPSSSDYMGQGGGFRQSRLPSSTNGFQGYQNYFQNQQIPSYESQDWSQGQRSQY